MNLALVIPSLGVGGAEGVMTWLANGLAGRGHAVTLFTLDDGRRPPFYALDPAVRHRPLGLASASPGLVQAIWANWRRIGRLGREVRAVKPDAALSFIDQTNVLALLALSRHLPVVVSERVHPGFHDIGPVWNGLRRVAYSRAAAVVVQSEGAAAFFPESIRSRCLVMPNPVVRPPSAPRGLGPSLPRPALVGMGRLVPQKGFDLLLRAFASIAARHPEWTLQIFGEGPARGELERLRETLGLSGRVFLPGVATEPYAVLAQADVFVLPSRFEGFPNVLCQAMACGVAVLAADCPSGPEEIVRHGLDGVLVPVEDAGALARSLEQLMSDVALRRALAERAPEILDRFEPEKILDRWEGLLVQAVSRCNQEKA